MKNKLRNFLRKRILPLALGSAMSFGMSAYFPAGDVVSAEETDLSMVTVTSIGSDRTLMSNGYIGILYRDDGRFLIGTTGGDPDNPDDDNRLLMYSVPKGQLDSAEAFSSFVTIKVNNLIDVFSTDSNKKYNMQESIPYESAKPMYLVDDVDNQELLRDIVLETCKDLKK